jgi:SAM-dependent methyltransferase
MKRSVVESLVCPVSEHSLELVATTADGDVERGELVCTGCGRSWPIQAGVPRLVPADLEAQQAKTARAFGWQWQHFNEMHREFEQQFLDWIHPLQPEFFRDKSVLDAGCGIGRHAYFAATYGAREVFALDLSAAVETAGANLARFDDVHVLQGDLLRLPFRTACDGGGFEFVYSIGVLHHLPDPYAGFRNLVRYVRPGGTLAVWVYGYENNGVVRNVVEPVRKVSTRIPPPALRTIAWPLAVAFHGLAKGVYRPLHGTPVDRVLPLNEYMSSVADFGFRQNYGIVFDQLAAPTAAYITGHQLTTWFEESGLEGIQISHRHRNSWRGQGRVPG